MQHSGSGSTTRPSLLFRLRTRDFDRLQTVGPVAVRDGVNPTRLRPGITPGAARRLSPNDFVPLRARKADCRSRPPTGGRPGITLRSLTACVTTVLTAPASVQVSKVLLSIVCHADVRPAHTRMYGPDESVLAAVARPGGATPLEAPSPSPGQGWSGTKRADIQAHLETGCR